MQKITRRSFPGWRGSVTPPSEARAGGRKPPPAAQDRPAVKGEHDGASPTGLLRQADRATRNDTQRNRWLVLNSWLFHRAWYESRRGLTFPDLDTAIGDFLREGSERELSPHPLFDTKHYVNENLKGSGDGVNPLVHFLERGAREERDPHPLFSVPYYVSQFDYFDHDDTNPLSHYLDEGADRGLNPHPDFDTAFYLANNRDVRIAQINPLVHYVIQGKNEGRPSRPSSNVSSSAGDRLSDLAAIATENYFSYREETDIAPVPLLQDAPPLDLPARVIAFYLPQFHPIPENDRWWGKGFTEWSNVTRARPQYVGHYQPRLPGELGFYDLRLKEVHLRQIELAKTYGVGAFCYYFYWFGGRRVLELPLVRHLTDADLDFPFCLCWANENWTRRWDGLDQDVLLQQDYGEEDDIAFISYVSKFLADPRYVRIDGKPLLLIYRPSLFPSVRNSAVRWRDWCRSNGVGEIHLAMTLSFDKFDPVEIGFDGAVEFPPNSSPVPEKKNVIHLNSTFCGKVYDWRALLERSRAYGEPRFPTFRAVCPSWDNEARRIGRSSILDGALPGLYGEWLMNAVTDSALRADCGSDPIVFVNAWNEWAEGAYLEPDRRYGYANLEATRMALVRAGLQIGRASTPAGSDEAPRLAIIIHAFYLDVFEEILESLGRVDLTHKLFVTTTSESAGSVRNILRAFGSEFEIIEHENRGRDVAPFLVALRRANAEGFPFVLKLHTKKSLHRGDGDAWRNEIYRSIATPTQIRWIIDAMKSSPTVGIVGPLGQLVSMGTYWGSNEARVRWLASRMCISSVDANKDILVAGTMFIARMEALLPALNLAIRAEDFEAEGGQTDGTLAHALERAFTYSARAAGLEIAGAPISERSADRKLKVITNDTYRFAVPSHQG